MAARRVLFAVLAGAVLVALVGIAIYLVHPSSVFLPVGGEETLRYRGVGQSPNTVAMLLAAALPLALLAVLEARRAGARATATAASVLLGGSIVASGSRGALGAAFAALLLFVLTSLRSPRRKVAAALVLAGLLAGGVAVAGTPKALARTSFAPTKVSQSGYFRPHTANDADFSWRLDDDIGHPGTGSAEDDVGPFRTSGRPAAWRGAAGQAARRPVVGYGFGTETRAFVDRYYQFQGGTPENSFLGMFLQLGAAGLVVFVSLLAAVAAACVRAARARTPSVGAACLGVLVVGIVLAFVQSYLYSVGNTATLSVWLCALLPSASAGRAAW